MTDAKVVEDIKAKLTDFIQFADNGRFNESNIEKSVDKLTNDLLQQNDTDSDEIKQIKNDVRLQLNQIKDTFTSDISNEELGNSFFEIKKTIPNLETLQQAMENFNFEDYEFEPTSQNQQINETIENIKVAPTVEKIAEEPKQEFDLTLRQVGEKSEETKLNFNDELTNDKLNLSSQVFSLCKNIDNNKIKGDEHLNNSINKLKSNLEPKDTDDNILKQFKLDISNKLDDLQFGAENLKDVTKELTNLNNEISFAPEVKALRNEKKAEKQQDNNIPTDKIDKDIEGLKNNLNDIEKNDIIQDENVDVTPVVERTTFIAPTEVDTINAFNDGTLIDVIEQMQHEQKNALNQHTSDIENFNNGIVIPNITESVVEKENHLKSVEMSTEDNYNMIDGIPNNTTPKHEEVEFQSVYDEWQDVKFIGFSKEFISDIKAIAENENYKDTVILDTLEHLVKTKEDINATIIDLTNKLDLSVFNDEIRNNFQNALDSLNDVSKDIDKINENLVDKHLNKSFEQSKGNDFQFFKKALSIPKGILKSSLSLINKGLSKTEQSLETKINVKTLKAIYRINVKNIRKGSSIRFRRLPEKKVTKSIKVLKASKNIINLTIDFNKYLIDSLEKTPERVNEQQIDGKVNVQEDKQYVRLDDELNKFANVVNKDKIEDTPTLENEVNKLATEITDFLKGNIKVDIEFVKNSLLLDDTDKLRDILTNSTGNENHRLIQAIDNLEEFYPTTFALKTEDNFITFEKNDNKTTVTSYDDNFNVTEKVDVVSKGSVLKDVKALTGEDILDLIHNEKNSKIDIKEIQHIVNSKEALNQKVDIKNKTPDKAPNSIEQSTQKPKKTQQQSR